MSDAVWLDVLPSMSGFTTNLVKESTKAANDAGKSAGKAWSNAVKSSGSAGADLVADLEKAARGTAQTVSTLSGKVAQARSAERSATADVVLAEQRLADAREKYGAESAQAIAADLKLEAARSKADAATTRYTAAVDQLKAAQREHREVTDQLESATSSLGGEVGQQGQKWRGLAGDIEASEDASEGVGDSLGETVGKAAAAAGAVALFAEALDTAFEGDTAVKQVGATLDLTVAESGRAGAAAGALYAQNYGDNMADVSGAVEAVMSSIDGMRSATEEDLTHATGVAISFADAFDVDVAEAARNAGILIKNGLAPDAVSAFDLMTAAAQSVPTALRGEAMDALQEYSTYFAQLGIDGPSAIAMITSSLENGQYGIDKMGDALKEFTIRAGSLSDTGAQQALENIGLKGEDVTNRLLAGGDSARSAMADVVAALQSVNDPGAQAAAAIALFGAPLEDLGTGKIPEFLDTLMPMGDQLADVAGKAERLDEGMSDAVSPIDEFTRGLSAAATEGLEPLLEPANQVMSWLQSVPGGFEAVAAALAVLVVGVAAATVAQWAMNTALWASPITWIIAGIMALVAAVVLLVANWDSVREAGTAAWDWIKNAWSSAGEWFSGIGKSIKDSIGDLWSGLWTSFKTQLNKIIRAWNDFDLTLGGGEVLGVSIPKVTLSTPNIPMLAEGGRATQSGLALVGEEGPELLALRAGASVLPLPRNPEARDSNPWRGGVHIDHADIGANLDEFAEEVEWRARR